MLQSSGVELLPFLVFSCLRNWNGSEWEADTEKGGICVQVVQKEEVSWSGPRTKKYSTASIKELEQNRWNPASLRQHRPFPKLIFFSILLFHLFEEL